MKRVDRIDMSAYFRINMFKKTHYLNMSWRADEPFNELPTCSLLPAKLSNIEWGLETMANLN